MRPRLFWVARATAGLFVIGIAFVATLLIVMWHEHKTGITLPPPTGHFAVGRTTFAWTNEAQTDEAAPSPASKRVVLVWMWYPATRSATDVPTDYLPANWRAALEQRQGAFLSTFVKRDTSLVRTHSVSDAAVSPEQRAYPVVILRAGASALTTDFTTLAEDLASHGYFVVGFDAPYRSFVAVLPDGRVANRSAGYSVDEANGNLADPVIGKLLAMWTSDVAFVVDQLQRLDDAHSGRFAGRIDVRRLGIVGHSLGGATALEFCREDPRCKAALDLDGIPFGEVVSEGLKKPGMFLLSDHTGEAADPASGQVLAEIRSIYDRLPDGRSYFVIRGANHFSFSDQILLNSQTVLGILRLFGIGGLDGRRGLAISADCVHTFFDVHLNGMPAAALTSLAEKYPEIQIEGR